MFGKCAICGHNEWNIVYNGPVRNGSFGVFIELHIGGILMKQAY